MTIQAVEVKVRKVPSAASARLQQTFVREMAAEMPERPRLVLDCSELRELDRSTCYLLVCCLEEALMRSGDAILAALPPGAEKMLRQSGLTRIFDVFATVAEAAHSFSRPSLSLSAGAVRATQVQVQKLQEDLQSAL
jgi:anti-anti-sigma factor